MVRLVFLLVLLFGSALSTESNVSKPKRSPPGGGGWTGLLSSPDYGHGRPWNVEENPWGSVRSSPSLQESNSGWTYGGVIKSDPPPVVITKHVVVEKRVKVPEPVLIEKKVPFPVEKIVHVPVDRIVHKSVPYPVPVQQLVPYPIERPVAVPVPYILTRQGLVPLASLIQPDLLDGPAFVGTSLPAPQPLAWPATASNNHGSSTDVLQPQGFSNGQVLGNGIVHDSHQAINNNFHGVPELPLQGNEFPPHNFEQQQHGIPETYLEQDSQGQGHGWSKKKRSKTDFVEKVKADEPKKE